jgi:hypothetical protein
MYNHRIPSFLSIKKRIVPMTLTYPLTPTVPQTDNYHGTLVADPYRWLEDVDSPETLDWIRRQME